MADFFRTIEVETAGELLGLLSPWSSNDLSGYIFRGHQIDTYGLVPNALRPGAIERMLRGPGYTHVARTGDVEVKDTKVIQHDVEEHALRTFFRLADRRGLYLPSIGEIRSSVDESLDHTRRDPFSQERDRWLPRTFLELAALAQHYGVPTRLLDWTYDPFVSLFFAAQALGNEEPASKLAIWCLDRWALAGETVLPLRSGMGQVEFVTPYYGGNPNLAAQQGLFTHWVTPIGSRYDEMQWFSNPEGLVDRRALDVLLAERFGKGPSFRRSVIIKILLNRSQAPVLQKILVGNGYGASRIFPGYSGVAMEVMGG